MSVCGTFRVAHDMTNLPLMDIFTYVQTDQTFNTCNNKTHFLAATANTPATNPSHNLNYMSSHKLTKYCNFLEDGYL